MATEPTSASYYYPDTWTNATDSASNYGAGLPQFSTDVYNNWYNQPLTTGQTPWQNQAWGSMMDPTNEFINQTYDARAAMQGSQPYYGMAGNAYGAGFGTAGAGVAELGKVTPYLQSADSMYKQGATYDPNQLNQYLNPYMQGANQATIDASNRNLTEKVLPGVNSTFAGAGQFGSSRNADFTNRAIRDQQQVLTETLGKQNYQNYATANQNYSDWANKGIQSASGVANLAGQQTQLGNAYGQAANNQYQAGQGFAGLGNSQIQYGQQLGGLANQGAQLYQQNLNNMNTAATQQQQQMQGTLDANYKDWANQQQFPLSSFNTVAGGLGSLSGAVRPNIAGSAVPNMDSLTQTLNALQTAGKSFSDPAVQNILQQLFKGA